MSKAPFVHRRRIHYSECTVGNHVYYSRYLDLLEEARGEFFRDIGWSLASLQGHGLAFPVRECQLKFSGPARYDDVVLIELWVHQVDRLWLKFGFAIRAEGGQLLVEGRTDHVCASTGEQPKRMPPALLESLKPFLRAAE